jgi:outer membrane protein assembly factor BamB
MRCAGCGSSTGRGARFCGRCGASLESPAHRSRPEGPQRRRRGPGRGGALAAAALALVAVAAAVVVTRGPEPAESGADVVAEDPPLGVGERWTADVGGEHTSWVTDPARGHGRLYTVANGALYALDEADGTVRWRYDDRAWIRTVPAVAGGIVVVATSSHLVGVDADGGETRWRTPTEDGRIWWHIVATPRLVVASGSQGTGQGLRGTVAAFDASSGAELWSVDLDGWISGAPSREDDVVVVATHGSDVRDGHVLALELESGALRWQAPVVGPAEPSLVAGAVVAATPWEVAAFDLGDGTERWRTEVSLPGRRMDPPGLMVVGDELVVGATVAPLDLVAMDLADGTVLWEERLELPVGEDEWLRTAVVPGLGLLVASLGEADGAVTAVDFDGRILWERRVPGGLANILWTAPGRIDPVDGRVWIGTGHGEVLALELQDGSVSWTASLWRGFGGETSPTAGDDVVIVERDGRLDALSTASGRWLWSSDEPRWPDVHAIGPSGSVFSLSRSGRGLIELDTARGDVIAQARLDPLADVRVLVADDTRVYAGSARGVHAVDTTHRRQRWFHPTEAPATDIAAGPDGIAVVDETGHVHLISPTGGEEAWRVAADACTAPVFSGDVVVVGTVEGLAGLSIVDGTERWRVDPGRPHCVQAAVSGTIVYTTDLVRTVTAIDAADGSRVWRRQIDTGVAAPPGASSDVVVVPDVGGTVHLLDPADGTDAGVRELGSPPLIAPIVLADAFLVLDRDGRLHAVPLAE